jgi:two-component system chemotaxis sensor kinase CheA
MSLEEQEVWNLYESDALEALREIEDSLLRLESDPASKPHIHRLYRGLHSLKGNSGFLRLGTIERLAHVAESLIGLVRDGGVALDREIVDLVLEAVDALRAEVESASRDRRDSDLAGVAGLVARIEAAFARHGGAQQAAAPAAGWGMLAEEVPPPRGAVAPAPMDDAGPTEMFLAMARQDLPRISAAILASMTADAAGAAARERLHELTLGLLGSAALLSFVHVVDALMALRDAAECVLSIPAAQSLDLDLHGAVVDVEAYYRVLAPAGEVFGVTALFRRACADMVFGDLARLRDLVDGAAGLEHDEVHHLYRRLRYACEYYGFERGAASAVELEDHFARAVEAGAVPAEDVNEAARRFVDSLGRRVHALNAGEDVGDPRFTESPTDPMKFASELAGLEINPALRRQLTRSALGTLSQVRARSWVPAEVCAILASGSAVERRLREWMTTSGVVCLTSTVEESEDRGQTYRLLLGVPSEAFLRDAFAAIDPDGTALAVGLAMPTRPAHDPQAVTVPPGMPAPPAPREAPRAEALAPADPPPRAPAPPIEASEEGDHGPRDASRADFLRVDARKVSLIMDLASEIGLACGAVTHHPDLVGLELEGFAAAAHKLELLVREMQNEVSSVRLVPVAGVFQRMKRVVRDAARRTGKQVDLVLEGEDTEIDKLMVDSLQDPLVHVLRNAVDHGIEPEAERVKRGKPPVGRLVLSASHQGGEVSIQVSDDGGGIDLARVLARARERDLVPAGSSPTDEEIADFVFLPGFSTKEKADELSGRGVGMDVVKTTMEALRGRVSLRSNAGRGSRVTMTMPLTLAFVEAMVVSERDRLFAIPIEKVFEVFKTDPRQLSRNSADGRTMIRVRDTLVPVLWLHRFWNDPGVFSERLDERVVVVVQTSRGSLAIPVDALLGNQQVMLKPLRGPLAGIRAAAGCGMLRSGDVAVALDCEQLHG